jgi:hypothetical protein
MGATLGITSESAMGMAKMAKKHRISLSSDFLNWLLNISVKQLVLLKIKDNHLPLMNTQPFSISHSCSATKS